MSRHSPPQKKRHHMNRMEKNPMPPIGAHLRSRACRLIFLAALRYFADSDRNDVERWDIPTPGQRDANGI